MDVEIMKLVGAVANTTECAPYNWQAIKYYTLEKLELELKFSDTAAHCLVIPSTTLQHYVSVHLVLMNYCQRSSC